MKKTVILSLSLFMVLAMGLDSPAPAQPVTLADGEETVSVSKAVESSDVMRNLQTAYYGERNSRERYSVYAVKADEEGYGQVASMFRAIARGEEIHAERIASVIEAGGIVAEHQSEPVVVLSTQENLQSAVEEQRYEHATMYPAYIKQARREKNNTAEQVYERNMAAEPSHMAWFQQALRDLDGYRGANIDFLVCTGCGNTVRAVTGKHCQVCKAPKENFEKVR